MKKLKEKKIDIEFSKWIRARDGKCLKCGTKENNQCAHIFSRTARSVRWDELNALTLCYKCHLFWAHKNPIEFTEFVRSHLGEKNFALLKRRYYHPKQWTDKQKQRIYENFKTQNDRE